MGFNLQLIHLFLFDFQDPFVFEERLTKSGFGLLYQMQPIRHSSYAFIDFELVKITSQRMIFYLQHRRDTSRYHDLSKHIEKNSCCRGFFAYVEKR